MPADFDHLRQAYLSPATDHVFGVTAVYRRQAVEVSVRVTPYNPTARVMLQQDIRLKMDERMFLVNAADLDFGSGALAPLSGDEIEISGEGPGAGRYRLARDSQPVLRGFGNAARWQLKMIRVGE